MPETERNVTALSPNDTKKDMAKGQVKADIRLKTGIWHAKRSMAKCIHNNVESIAIATQRIVRSGSYNGVRRRTSQ